ncbi:DUF6887 family protein [Gloeobacter morelensis]|uniref:DUF6887 family protein n=1 Tax=Gloeobacter morelensis TaxID=2907343 RepID=UPI003AB94AF2
MTTAQLRAYVLEHREDEWIAFTPHPRRRASPQAVTCEHSSKRCSAAGAVSTSTCQKTTPDRTLPASRSKQLGINSTNSLDLLRC